MDSGIRAKTNEILSLVERVSGFPVEVLPDSNLKTHATVKMARGGVGFHLVTYNPAKAKDPDYLIAYQCGFILRKFGLTPDQRKDFLARPSGREEVRRGIKGLPGDVVEAFADHLFQGLLLQVLSVPVGLRVDSWISREYPGLAPLQDTSITRQLRENAQALDPKYRQIAPAKVSSASLSMNAAFALFWSEVAGDQTIALPYKATPFWAKGLDLLNLLRRIPDQPERDVELIDCWAESLGIRDWYDWIPFK